MAEDPPASSVLYLLKYSGSLSPSNTISKHQYWSNYNYQTRTFLATQNAAESPCPVQKQSWENTENQFGSVDLVKLAKKKCRKNLTEDKKLTKIFSAIHDLNWSIGDFLFYAFR
ncbi:hypothetical protein C8J56DRAFT_881920 [Mycena floridula]|nr:hypothetical protein C8J56DRAFT_881920 [Mycena floridula]